MVTVYKCDRCYKQIPDTQHYNVQIGLPLTSVTLCRQCIDEYKIMLERFRNYNRPNRERMGSLPKGYTGSDYPLLPPYICSSYLDVSKEPEEPKHEGRRPTNIFSKIFYKMFFQRVE